jgi:hypothetical protein
MIETRKDIPGYGGKHQVGRDADVWRTVKKIRRGNGKQREAEAL